MPPEPAPAQPIRVLFVLQEDSLVLDWAGPAEALRMANQVLLAQGQPARFALEFVSSHSSVTSSVGLQLRQLAPLPSHWDERCCWLVLVGQTGQRIDLRHPGTQTLLHWLRGLRLAANRLELVCICAGSVLAAHAGLLSGRRATTHHQHLQELGLADAHCEVQHNRVFVLDPPVYSSAGVTTGIDLMLHRLAQVCGPALAAQVAQTMVMPLRRGPGDAELSPFLLHRQHLHPALHRVQDALSQNPQQAWTPEAMAALAHTSVRHLSRLFGEHVGISPRAYLQSLRLALAQNALQAGHSVTHAAELAGFSSDNQLRRVWRSLQPEQPAPGRKPSSLQRNTAF